jgi:2-methylisocitrate lyase-like PEP mutase family enzyme
MDQQVTLDELEAHVASLIAESPVPLSVDAENGYANTPKGVAVTVERLAATGAAGVSIEDYSAESGIYELREAAERVAAAAVVARRHGVVLTGRAENHLYGADDLDDTIERLLAYQEAGADVLYAPGPTDLLQIRAIVDEVTAPVNVLLRRGGPSVPQLAEIGVRRVSTGGGLAFAAYGALDRAARELIDNGTSSYIDGALAEDDRLRAFQRET